MALISSILETVGNTPIVRLSGIEKKYSLRNNIYAKLEGLNPYGSIKDRIALNMLKKAQERGDITPGKTVLVEATSGNTGIAISAFANLFGYKTKIVMPEYLSAERKKAIKYFGGELILTPKEVGVTGAYNAAREIAETEKDHFWVNQFSNEFNVDIHYNQTAPEIWNDLDGKIDVFVAGVGTGGTITGVGKYLKERNSNVKVIAVEPSNSRLLSGGSIGPHVIQGIGDEFMPDILDMSLVDQIIDIQDNEAYEKTREAFTYDSLPVGISSGANIMAAIKLDKQFENKNIVTVLADNVFRYFSTDLVNY